MSIVMWKVLQSQVASDEDRLHYPQLEARLQRIARESAVPIGAYWKSPPEERVQVAPVPVVAEQEGPVIEVEERVEQAPALPEPVPVAPQARPTRELEPRTTRMVSQPRKAVVTVPVQKATVRSVERPLSSVPARSTTSRTTRST